MKKTKINQRLEERVLSKLTDKFQEKGFKYKKGIKGFDKRENGILYEVTISDERYDLFMDTGLESGYDLFLVFKMDFETKLYEFEKWYYENITKFDGTKIKTFRKVLKFCIPLKANVDFDIPTDFHINQQTILTESKRLEQILQNNVYQFSSFDIIEEVDDFDSHINKVFSTFEQMIETKYDYLQLYNSEEKDNLGYYNSDYMKYNALLIYDNQLELPTKFIIDTCNESIAKISKSDNQTEKTELLEGLNEFIDIADKHLGLKISNPFV